MPRDITKTYGNKNCLQRVSYTGTQSGQLPPIAHLTRISGNLFYSRKKKETYINNQQNKKVDFYLLCLSENTTSILRNVTVLQGKANQIHGKLQVVMVLTFVDPGSSFALISHLIGHHNIKMPKSNVFMVFGFTQ